MTVPRTDAPASVHGELTHPAAPEGPATPGHGAADHGDRAVSGTRTGTTDGGAIHADQRLETVRLVLVLCLDLTGQQRANLRLPHRVPGPVVDPALVKHPLPAGAPLSFTPALLGVFATTHWKALSRYFLGMA